jgi:hypothetical protein
VIDRLRDEEHPVLTGLVALVAVGLAVGLVLGGVAVAATSVLGLGDEGSSQTASDDTDFYLPKPSPTEGPSGPLITLAPSTEEEGPSESAPAEPDETEETEAAEEQITLSAGQTSVAPMEQIDLTGVYPGGEGAILQVQKFSGGAWQEFPVTAVVSNETFATFVQTSFQGVNRFRVVDNDTGVASNEVKVTVG